MSDDPSVDFFPHNYMTISCDSVLIECRYWIQWGEQIWNVDVIGVKGSVDDDASLTKIIVRALRPRARILVVKRGGKLLWKTSLPSVGDSTPKVI